MIEYSGLLFSSHAVKRMLEKNITAIEVEQTLRLGEPIQLYPEDKPYPSQLLLSFVKDRPIHVVVALIPLTKECIVITCYEPDTKLWTSDFKSKKP